MAIRIPKKIFGEEVSDATVKNVLKGLRTSDDPASPVVQPPRSNVSSLDGFIYVPSADLHFAKERTHYGTNWEQAHLALAQEGSFMPTPAQTWELLKYLKGNLADPECRKVYDEILKKKDPWKGEWQNAKYLKISGKMSMREVEVRNGKVEHKSAQNLDACLMEDCWADFDSANKQGLLTRKSSDNTYKQGNNIYFWYPREGAVARFGAVSDGAGLGCDGGPSDSNDGLGVRAVRRATARKK
ncbi:MAG: hypothetical protein Q7R96_02580 [Nanoarchaeota archaeon]|nr:hypothetical protein [Nanoarchaeota archaeon]